MSDNTKSAVGFTHGHNSINFSVSEFSLKPIARALQISAVGIGLGLGQSAHAAIITVTGSGDINNNCTLREALVSVNAAAAVPGCTAVGAFGTNDTIVFGGELAAGGTIPLSAGILYLDDNLSVAINAPIEGVTVDGQSNSGVMGVGNSASLSIDNLTITGGSAILGAGVYLGKYGSLTATNSTITGNTANLLGGGIHGKYGSQISLEESFVTQNNAPYGGGISSVHMGGPGTQSGIALDNSTVMNNMAVASGSYGSSGGGILTFGNVTNYINESTISGNTAIGSATEGGGEGGGLSILSNPNSNKYNQIINSTITDNVSSGGVSAYGAGIFMNGDVGGEEQPGLAIVSSSITSNTASGSGGGVALREAIAFSKYGSLSSNMSSQSGGGLALESAALITFGTSIVSNNAEDNGGGAYLDEASVIYALPSFGSGSITNSLPTAISNNTATNSGGGLYFAAGSGSSDTSTIFGGEANVLKYASVAGNTGGEKGGGVYLGGTGSGGYPARLFVGSTTVSGNLSGSDSFTSSFAGGGGIFLSSTAEMQMTNSTISGNRSSGWNGGGGLLTYGGTAVIQNSTFSNNRAGTVATPKYGGGISNVSGGEVNFYNGIIANSAANNNCNSSGTFTIDTFSIVEGGGCGASRTGDPGLLPLRDNGGLTLTHLPKEGTSIAIDTGNNATCGGEDQRGEIREANASDICDVGAVEFVESDREITTYYVIPLPSGKSVVIQL